MGKTSKRSANRKSKAPSDGELAEAISAIGRGTGGDGGGEFEEFETGERPGGREEPDEDKSRPAQNTDSIKAKKILDDIGREFIKLRSKSAAEAWKFYQKAINENMGLLSELISVKDLVELSLKIEEKMKTETSGADGSPLEQVQAFLNGSTVN